MNIFILHNDPVVAAQMQCDKHVPKMVVESAQMLSTAHRELDGDRFADRMGMYKKAHVNHPSTIWTRQNSRQYYWLFHHMLGLGNEYTKRYGKKHLSITKCFDALKNCPVGMPLGGEFNEPPQAMPEEYKVPGCSITAYWNYYEGEKYTVAAKDEMLITRDKLYGTEKIIPTFDTA